MQSFIHLRVHSDYSLGYSAIKIPELIKFAKDNSIPALSLSDRFNLYGSLEFSKAAYSVGIQPITSSVFKVLYSSEYNDIRFGELLLIAQNQPGYKNLIKLSSKSYIQDAISDPYITMQDLEQHSEGIIVLCGTRNSPAGQHYINENIKKGDEVVKILHNIFKDRLYIEIMRKGDLQEEEIEKHFLNIAYKENIPLVATNEVCFLDPSMHEAHDVMLCIANSRYILEDDRPKSNIQSYFKSTQEMLELFQDLPEAVMNSVNIAKRISFVLKGRSPVLPRFAEDIDEGVELKEQAKAGLERYLQSIPAEDHHIYTSRLNYEIEVIEKMKYSGYFLIVSDFIKWSKKNDIPVGPGRGSGAGSLVAWTLEITDLDPIKFGLLFERFLNPDRVSMPDFDIDFCQERRSEVIEYVRKKYGQDRVANIITFGKLQARAVLRDVGRVLQMHYGEIDRICKMVPHNPANPITLAQAIDLDKNLQELKETDPNIAKLIAISLQLEGMNRHSSTHAAGIVIADEALVEIAPLCRDQNGDTVLQYSMKMAEDAGLVKFDFLGLKTLTVIAWTCAPIGKTMAEMNSLDLADPATYASLTTGDTTGVFQFESAGMRQAIKKLKPNHINDLIALCSLYRPGPMDNIPSYINRKHGLEKPEYINPKLEHILKETYGIIVYQEQVMEIAQVLSGYSLAEADLLRRAMGKKIKSEMEAQRAIFVKGAQNKGIDKNQAIEIFNLVAKFASYGFNKSHAAAYAVISYQTAYLKTHYPVQFLIASLNLEIDDTDKIHLFCQEAHKLNIKILPPSINHSQSKFSEENGNIRFALGAIKNVGVSCVDSIIAERNKNGAFKDIFDFLERCVDGSINKRMLENCIKAGAFNEISDNPKALHKNVEILLRYAVMSYKERLNKQRSLFSTVDDANSARPLLAESGLWSSREGADVEFEALGFYLSSHPMARYQKKLAKKGVLSSKDIENLHAEKPVKVPVAGVITSRKIRSSAKGKYAFIQLVDLHGLLEVSIFDEQLLAENDNILQVGKMLYMDVEVKKDANASRVVVERIADMEAELRGVNIIYHVVILNQLAARKLQELISNEGNSLKISANINGNMVHFRNSRYKLPDLAIEVLSTIPGIEIAEQ